MTPETSAILAVGASLLAVGASLAVLIWQGQRAAREDRIRLETALRGELQTSSREAKESQARLETRMQSVEHGQAKLEGLLEGLREAIAGRRAA